MLCHGWRAGCSPRSEAFPSQGHWCSQLRHHGSPRLPHPNWQVHRPLSLRAGLCEHPQHPALILAPSTQKAEDRPNRTRRGVGPGRAAPTSHGATSQRQQRVCAAWPHRSRGDSCCIVSHNTTLTSLQLEKAHSMSSQGGSQGKGWPWGVSLHSPSWQMAWDHPKAVGQCGDKDTSCPSTCLSPGQAAATHMPLSSFQREVKGLN